MHIGDYRLGINDEVMQMIRNGQATRIGGVIRRNDNMQLVAYLQDVDMESNSELITGSGASAIPLAVLGLSLFAINKRLTAIDNKINLLMAQNEKISSSVDISNIKMDAMLLGELYGCLRACSIEIREERTDNLINYRRAIIEKYCSIKYFVEQFISTGNRLKDHSAIFIEYVNAMILAGIAARDISFYAKEYDTAINFSNELRKDIEEIEYNLTKIVKSPSALFWQTDMHNDVVLSVRESCDRLKGHELVLLQVPRDEIEITYRKYQL